MIYYKRNLNFLKMLDGSIYLIKTSVSADFTFGYISRTIAPKVINTEMHFRLQITKKIFLRWTSACPMLINQQLQVQAIKKHDLVLEESVE